MLLRGSLQDKEIPHRDRIREGILDKWHDWFGELKKELNVRLNSESPFCIRELIRIRMHQAGLASQPISGPHQRSLLFLRSLPTGLEGVTAVLFP
jgi:hypothetical protein